ncbi:MAG: polysaccharide biosynthesis C-terminal domain-containing protein [Terracidiphilus sp.]
MTEGAMRNFGFSGARITVAGISSLIISVITARSLGAQQMGTYSFIFWVVGTIAGLSSLGLPDAIAKYVAEYSGVGNPALAVKVARTIIATQILAAILISLVGAGVWAALDRYHLILILLGLATVLPFALQQTLLALMEGSQRFDLQLIATLCGSAMQIAIVATFAARHASVQGFVLATFLSTLALTGFTLFLCRPMLVSLPSSAAHGYSPDLSRRIFNFSISVYALWFLNLVVFDKSEMFFLRIFKSPQEIAYYSIAFALTARLATAGESISCVLFPMFVTRYTHHGTDGLREIYQRSMRYLQMLMVPIFVWAMPLTPGLLVFVYGREFAPAGTVVQVLLGTLLITLTIAFGSNVIYTMERQAHFVRVMILVAAVNILLDLLLVPRYGALGAAFANGLSQAFAVCGLIMIVQKVLPGAFPGIASMKIYLAAAISIAPIIYAEQILRAGILITSVSVVAAVLIYLGLLSALHAVTKSEVEAFGDGFMSVVFRRAG